MPTQLIDRKREISPFLLLAAVLILTFLSPNFERLLPYPESMLSLVLCGAVSAWLFHKAPIYLGASAVFLTFLRGWYLTSSPLKALSFLLYLPIGISYTLVSRRKIKRATAAHLSGGILAIAVASVLAAVVIRRTGAFSIDAILEAFPSLFSAYRNALSSMFTVTIADVQHSYISHANIRSFYNLILSVAPGLILMGSLGVAYLSGVVYRILLTALGEELPLRSYWKLRPSLITAVYFLIALIVSLLCESVPMILATGMNVLFILAPGLLLAGIGSVFEIRMVNGLPRPRLLRPTLLLLALFIDFIALLGLLIAFACYDAVIAAIPRKKLKK